MQALGESAFPRYSSLTVFSLFETHAPPGQPENKAVGTWDGEDVGVYVSKALGV